MSSSVAIIILNWNNPDDTLACLRSVMALDYPAERLRVIVVDNGSTDDSVARIRAAYPDVALIETGANLGYAGGNNVGIQYALDHHGCDYVWLLNDDVIVAPDSLPALMSVALADPRAGFLGPMVYTREEPQRILSAGSLLHDGWRPQHRGIGERDQGQFDTIAEVDYLSGCALLVSHSAIEAVGMLDEDFFAYHEDIEWCYRGKKAGFKVLFVPEAKVWHPDTLRRDENSPVVTYYIARNSLLFVKKHRLGHVKFARMLLGHARTLLSWSLRPRWRHKRPQRDALARALADFARGRVGSVDEI